MCEARQAKKQVLCLYSSAVGRKMKVRHLERNVPNGLFC